MESRKGIVRSMILPVVLLFLGTVVLVSMLGCKTVYSPEADQKLVEEALGRIRIETPPNRNVTRPLVLAHYMPWYEAVVDPDHPENEYFGWHWHMGFFDPYTVGPDGKREIASHYYPLTGPYDSRDPDLIEYQLLLMKMAGIDGVIVDWYGIKDALDYGFIHEATQALFQKIEEAGLKFVVCYEDQTIRHMIDTDYIKSTEAVDHGKEVFSWLEANWFQSPSYVKIEGRPVVMVFGPQYFTSASEWDAIFSGLAVRPYLVTLDAHLENAADTLYPWPPMYLSGGGELSILNVVDYLNGFYAKTNQKEHLIATAFPRFHDIYREAGVGPSYGYLADLAGGTFHVTFIAAVRAVPDIVQIATWNDYGEGTVIEPTEEYGYRDLEYLQEWRKSVEAGFPFSKADLRIPLGVFTLRKQGNTDPRIDQLVSAVFAGQVETARSLAQELGL
ncbi:glycoside hydrolase family 71/99-like protein [Spirochaeta thermophila]|uniref:Uncharacterized protein n=1 Tax=Winmispira thermophila (strain ATCC 49972 / DSM 6192 / RI 19.B1) TaxID=665571 RepID=E0RTU5_WINT6|nr:glycoside hydrolase family 71/99-like protein [Spirochaeta thermophila]ADN02470.1 hypothetical protein STHERM_c15300 [Spirochaeta thermophila DSM 6192]